MEEKITKVKYLSVTLILGLIVTFNFLSLYNQTIGLLAGLAYIIFYSFIFGSIFISQKPWQSLFGLLFFISLVSIVSALAIYFYKFNDMFFIILIWIIPLFLINPYYKIRPQEKFSLPKLLKKYLEKVRHRKEHKLHFLLVILYLVLTSLNFILLFYGQTIESIQAPWQVVPSVFLLIYFLATLCLLIYVFNAKRTKLPLILISIHTFLSSSIALIVYKIGYGFDPFIHQATEKIINQTGSIDPTPLYYLGQYGLVVFLHKLTLIDLVILDRLLVPVLFSLLLPSITFYVFSKWIPKNYALILSLVTLIIPYSSFIMTAPQNLANLFFIITILLSLLYFRNQLPVSILYLLTITTLVIHPLAGIPLLITVLLINLFKMMYSSYIKSMSLYFFASLVFVLFLPLAFMINGSNLKLSMPIFSKVDFPLPVWLDRFDLPLNLVYLINFNQAIFAGLIILIGIVYIAKNNLLKNNAPYLMAAFIIFSNFIITKYFLTFPDLRIFDQNSFVSRLSVLTFYTLLPFFLIGLYVTIKNVWTKDIYLKSFLVLTLAGGLTISLYLSYPRFNQFEPAKFFSLSQHDINAVNLIEKTASPQHIVLANQMVGVAAIKEFGFKQYYDNQFFYSMPMGSPRTFYDHFLAMTHEGAKKQTMESVMDEAGVDEAYFVLNSYWRDFDKIATQARQSAETVYDIDEGKILIFKYIR